MQITAYSLKSALQAPLTVAVVADLHDKPYDEVLNGLKKLKPDIITIPGDLMGSPLHAAHSLDFLYKAVKLAPVFYSPGNHERIDRSGAEAVARTGAVLLNNSSIAFRGIYIGGLSSGFKRQRVSQFEPTPPPDLRWLARFSSLPGFKLLLCHHPEYYLPYIKPLDVDVILAGHAHGGQWRIFGHGVFAPGQGIFPTLTSGVVDNRLVISRGLANTAGVPRLFNPPELVFVRLLPCGGIDTTAH